MNLSVTQNKDKLKLFVFQAFIQKMSKVKSLQFVKFKTLARRLIDAQTEKNNIA